MLDFSSLISGAPGPADFSTIVCYRHLAFGLIAYRQKTCILLGEETVWMQIPSWLTALSFLALAATEWFILKLLAQGLRKWYASRRQGRGASA